MRIEEGENEAIVWFSDKKSHQSCDTVSEREREREREKAQTH